MKYKVLLSFTAINDLKDICDYITNELSNPIASRKIYRKIKNKIISLSYMPKKFRTVFPNCEYRIANVCSYSVIYSVDDDNKIVNVTRIIYTGMNINDIIK